MLGRRRTHELLCVQAVELVTDYLEGALSDRDRRRFEQHVADCPNCPEYLAQMRATVATLGRIEPEELDPDVRDEIVRLYRRWREG